MKVPIDKLVQSARGEILCEFCGRQWFGLVAYCPYCGRKPGFTVITQPADDRLQSDKSPANGQVAMPAGELQSQKEMSTLKEPGGTPPQAAPMPGENIRFERNRPPPPRSNDRASAFLFKTAVAGVSVLFVFWLGFKLLAPRTIGGASPQPPVSTSGIASPRRDEPTSAAQVPPMAPRTDAPVPARSNAAQAPSIAPPTDAPVRPPSATRSLCSAASEAAGLCKPQG